MKLVRFLTFAFLAGALFLVLGSLNRGYGLYDEAFYVSWIAEPRAYAFTYQPFGIPLHALYQAFGRSLIALRLAGVLMLIVSGGTLGFFAGRYVRSIGLPCGPEIALESALLSLSYYVLWVLTPSYNLLANAAAALAVAGAFGWATPGSKRLDRISSILVGIGGCYAFYGKPTLALALAIFAFGWLLRTARVAGIRVAGERALLVGFACGLPLLLHLVFVMPPGRFLDEVRVGTLAGNYGNALPMLPRKLAHELLELPPLFGAVVMCFAFAVSQASAKATSRLLPAIILGLAVTSFVGSFVVMATKARPLWDALGPSTMMIAMSVLALASWGTNLGPRFHVPMLVLIFLPLVIAIGTANNTVNQTGLSMFAPLVAILISARTTLSERHYSFVKLALAATLLLLLFYAWSTPYDLPRSIAANRFAIGAPLSTSTIYVDGETKSYVESLKELRERTGIQPGTPMLDLTGGGPGTVQFLGGRQIGFPWAIPGFGNEAALLEAIWSSVPPDVQSRVWIIGPIDGRFAKTRVAAHLRRAGYSKVGTTVGISFRRGKATELWKPPGNDPQALQSVPPLQHQCGLRCR